MSSDRQELLERVSLVVQRTFGVSLPCAITEQTTSADVDGWDSLSHAIFIMNVEREFNLEFPIDEVYALPDIGSLLDLLDRMKGSSS